MDAVKRRAGTRGVGDMNEAGQDTGNTIRLAERRIFSGYFKSLYDEGMGLVEQAAEYLDGDGRAAARSLSRYGATLYAAESMRLTTRLMQIASWLLLQRAANSGEMTRDQVAAEKVKVRLDTPSVQDETSGWQELPADFRAIVDHSLRLQSLVRRMDEEIYGEVRGAERVANPAAANPVSDQLMLLQTAFARG
jgi:regulator of CtrA degradation